jgi:hypothetical protein
MDTSDIIKKRIETLGSLYKRMDRTRDLVYNTPFHLKNFKGDKRLENVINVTPNKAATFANAIIADLLGGKWQTIIEGEKLTDKQSYTIERWCADIQDQTNEWLMKKQQISSLDSWAANHVCVRGPIGVRWIIDIVDGELVVDCLPVDMRWTPYEGGANGIVDGWVCPRSFRSAEDLNIEYAAEVNLTGNKFHSVSGNYIEVQDWWSAEKNEVWVDGKMVRTQDNPFGYPPFVIAVPSVGFMLRDKDYISHEGEDILFLNRDIYDEYARSVSIEQSIGMDVLNPPYEQEVEDIAQPNQKPPKSGETLKVKKGETHKRLERGDLNNASMAARQDIGKMITEGGYSDVDLGIFATTPPSALLVTTETEIRGKLQNSRREALQVFKVGSLRMQIDQYLQIAKTNGKGGEILVGKRGRRHTYSPDKLKNPDDYTITCQLMTTSKRQEIANLALFTASAGHLPLKVRLRDILVAEDPEGIMRELDNEKAREADPAIGMFEMAMRLVDEADDEPDEDVADAKRIESQMMTERGTALIRARMNPQPGNPVSDEAREPKRKEPAQVPITNLMPLMSNGGGAMQQPSGGV